MNKKFLFLAFVLLSFFSKAQIQIAVQNADQSSFVSTFAQAYAAAVDGSTIYLPQGVFDTNGIKLSKKIKIVGIGHKAASNPNGETTKLTGNLTLTAQASGSTFEGLSIAGAVHVGTASDAAAVTNLTFSRCHFLQQILSLSETPDAYPTQNVLLHECIISEFQAGHAQEVLVTKCIFKSYLGGILGGVTFRNSIFLYKGSTSTFLDIMNATFENNIFLCSYSGISGSTLVNNIFSSGETYNFANDNNTASGNITGLTLAQIFTNVPDRTFSYDYDYSILTGGLGANAGSDHYDIGIFGTSIPFKKTCIPSNPHIDSYDINSSTDSQGRLNITIKVTAQTN